MPDKGVEMDQRDKRRSTIHQGMAGASGPWKGSRKDADAVAGFGHGEQFGGVSGGDADAAVGGGVSGDDALVQPEVATAEALEIGHAGVLEGGGPIAVFVGHHVAAPAGGDFGGEGFASFRFRHAGFLLGEAHFDDPFLAMGGGWSRNRRIIGTSPRREANLMV
jgi:hypothetical protein